MGEASWLNCTLDADSAAWVRGLKLDVDGGLYREDDLRNDLQTLLERFRGRGGVGLRTITRGDLKKGRVRHMKHFDRIYRELAGEVLEEHHISGTSDKGLNVKEEACESVQFLLSQGVLTGVVENAANRLRKALVLKSSV